MRSLYESILSDIDTNLDVGTQEAALLALNQPDSDARQMFGIHNGHENAFVLKDNYLVIDKSAGSNGFFVNMVDYNISDILSDINVDTILFKNACTFFGDGKFSDKTLKPTLITSRFSFNNFTDVTDVNLICDPARSGNDFIPTITFDDKLKNITNCRIEIFYNDANIKFCKIPTLKNVSSTTIKFIRIVPDKGKFEWRDTVFNKLFEFGYNVEFTYPGKHKTNTVKISNMSDIKKLTVAKDFHSRVYTELPYRIKNNAKLSDMIDISKFDKLERVLISDNNMFIVFENTKLSNCHTTSLLYFNAMLKKSHEIIPKMDERTDILDQIPTTADGWKVFIVRM